MWGRFINADGAIADVGGSPLEYNQFAYCFNNPVNLTDQSGNWPSAFKTVIKSLTAMVRKFYQNIAKNNSFHNSNIDRNPSTTTENKILNDQNGATGTNFEYGLHPASWNACEAIAVHNAKVLKGMNSSLSATITNFQNAGAMIGDGFFGSNPYAIGRVLSREGIAYSRVGINNMHQEGTYIISFWNEGAPWNGLHTVAVSYNGSQYTAYNLNGKARSIQLASYTNRYICGYFLG